MKSRNEKHREGKASSRREQGEGSRVRIRCCGQLTGRRVRLLGPLWFFWANDQTMSVAAALGPQDAQEDTLLIKGAGQASWAGASLG